MPLRHDARQDDSRKSPLFRQRLLKLALCSRHIYHIMLQAGDWSKISIVTASLLRESPPAAPSLPPRAYCFWRNSAAHFRLLSRDEIPPIVSKRSNVSARQRADDTGR